MSCYSWLCILVEKNSINRNLFFLNHDLVRIDDQAQSFLNNTIVLSSENLWCDIIGSSTKRIGFVSTPQPFLLRWENTLKKARKEKNPGGAVREKMKLTKCYIKIIFHNCQYAVLPRYLEIYFNSIMSVTLYPVEGPLEGC